MLNLDTHVLVYALLGELAPAERVLLSANRWSVSSIVLWELAKLVQLGRLDLDLDDREVARVFRPSSRLADRSRRRACLNHPGTSAATHPTS